MHARSPISAAKTASSVNGAAPALRGGAASETRRVRLALALSLGLAAVAGTASALDKGARAPELGGKDLTGKTVSLASLAGKVVIVDFWATWCAPCKEEMPVLERLYQKYKGRGLVVVGVSVDEEAGNVAPFIKKMKVSFPIVHDQGHKIADRFKPPKMPSSYIIDRKGIVRYIHEGFHAKDAAVMEAEINALLK
jgi:cytochrome c biogenesis protein CcmG, thiol:disulfide interchange protein DsbE